MKKRDWNFLILCLISVVMLLFSLKQNHLFGSTTDWFSQHIVFPDYFRKLFYATGNLFPNFAPHIGGGQNIYYFSYYGLLNPVYFFSYLIPFVEMIDYIQIVNILTYFLSVLLCYQFLKKEFSKEVSLVCSILFLCSGPLLFHLHRHVMFVHYMPFLLLALIGIQRYAEKRNYHLIVFGIFMMIMTSYYYSVGGLICLAFYAIYKGIQNQFQWRDYRKVSLIFLLGVFLSSILLLPTAYTIFGGGRGTSTSLRALFLPTTDFGPILYSHYSIGLTMISLIALFLGLVSKKKEVRILSLCMLVLFFFPIFSYLLNGKLYTRSKVFIPFLPLVLFSTGELLETWKTCGKKEYGMLFVVFVLCFFNSNWFLWLDFGLVILSYFLLKKFPKLGYLPLLLCGFYICIQGGTEDKFISDTEYQKMTENQNLLSFSESARFVNTYNIGQSMNRIPNANAYSLSFYSSVFNSNYQDFFVEEFQNPLPLRNKLDFVDTNNGLFSMYMGASYYVGENVPIGYESNGKIYENKDVLPIAYVSSNLSSLKEYEDTSYPYSLENLYQTIVVDKEVSSSLKHEIQEVSLSLNLGNDLTFENVEHQTIHLQEPIQNQFLFLQFDLLEIPSCKDGDLSITINGQTNKLTCRSWLYHNGNTTFHYVLSSNDPITDLEVTFSKGHFLMDNVKTYVLDYESIRKRKEEVDPVSLTINGDSMEGTVDVRKDGYFILNMPYDKGFQVTLDGKEISYEKVNISMIGFPITEGHHEILISFEAPYQEIGMILSIFSLGIWISTAKKKKL